MDKATYKKAYRYARLLNLAKDQNGGNCLQRKQIRKQMKSDNIDFVNYKWAETNFYNGWCEFVTASSEKIYRFNPEYATKSWKQMVKRQFVRRLKEIYQN